MDQSKEMRRARSAYDWLKISPIVTVGTLFFIASLNIGDSLCGSSIIYCGYSDITYLNFLIGVVVSALWHLVLLYYAIDKESGLVREHGRKALIQAGIRTGVAVFCVVLDWSLDAGGGFACFAVVVLLMIWAINARRSKRWVEGDSPPAPEESDLLAITQPKPLVQPTPEMLAQVLADLDSEDDVVVLAAIDGLENFTISNESILNRLEQLADEDENIDIRMDARGAFNRLKNPEATSLEGIMPENENRKPEEILNELHQNLQSDEDVIVLQAIAQLALLSFSSVVIRRRLEKLAVSSANPKVRAEALTALSLPTNRAVQQRSALRKLDRGVRYTLLQEIEDWKKSELLDKQSAEVIRRRYDFDFAQASHQPQPAPAAPAQADLAPRLSPATATVATSMPEPRLSLLQTLTSEASIKIYLYLGAFFVIAAAAILGAVVPELRLPILIVGTLIFGGLSIAVKKRLPQPSFALFIVFSFLLPITANSIEETLIVAFGFTQFFSNAYWSAIFILMTLIWVGSTWLYESRLFSIAALGSLILAFLRIGDFLDADPALFTLLFGLVALFGLAGTWLLKKWRDDKFALLLFIATQLLQIAILFASLSTFGVQTFNQKADNLWNLAGFATWGLATIFYILSDWLFVFPAFAWLAAGALVPMSWFFASAFEMKSLSSSITMFVWGILLAGTSEILRRFEFSKKYGLPTLIAALPSLALAVGLGFAHKMWLGLVIALGSSLVLALLHIFQTRWWLWSFALLNFIIAYFAFFQLEAIQKMDIFFGYLLTFIIFLFLTPDLVLKKEWNANLQWRLPLRILGAAFLFGTSIYLIAQQKETRHVAINFAVLAIFFAAFALTYRNAILGYLPAAYLALSAAFTLNALKVDLWLPALTGLAVLYYLFGVVTRKNESWGGMLRISGLTLGVALSVAALFSTKEAGGWYVLLFGALFIAEMYLRRNGWFEVSSPILFTIGTFLILRDFDVDQIPYHLLAYSLIWILTDLLAHLTFFSIPRPLSVITRIVGGALTLINFGFLFAESGANIPSLCFGIYTLLFLIVSLLYRKPVLLYAFTLTLPFFATFLFRTFEVTQWIHPVIVVALLYYAAGTSLRATNRAQGWSQSLLYSGLGAGVIVSSGALVLGGLDASIPVAIAATLWAFEAFTKRNVWLAFPSNVLYLLAYFIILFEMQVEEPQFFSIGTALFGLIQHYLLTRAESKTGTFIMGMFSQFVLLGTTYVEMVNRDQLGYFFLLFAQSLVILVYGLVIRSRSLTFFPIGFVALGVVTVVYSALKDRAAIFVIGCTGILLLMLGAGAVLLRERIAKLSDKLSDWKA